MAVGTVVAAGLVPRLCSEGMTIVCTAVMAVYCYV